MPLTALICENGNNIKNTQVTNHAQYHHETHLPLGNILHKENQLQNTEPTEQNYLLVWTGMLSTHTVARPLHKHSSISSISLSIYY